MSIRCSVFALAGISMCLSGVSGLSRVMADEGQPAPLTIEDTDRTDDPDAEAPAPDAETVAEVVEAPADEAEAPAEEAEAPAEEVESPSTPVAPDPAPEPSAPPAALLNESR